MEVGEGKEGNGEERATHLEGTAGLATAVTAGGRQVLPEEGVVDVAAAVEVEERRDRGGLCEIALALGLGDGLERAVEPVDVRLVVLGVVQLHDLARDVRLEGSVVVCGRLLSVTLHMSRAERRQDGLPHWRRGATRVAKGVS